MVPLLVASSLLACNRYDLFRIAGYQQESFNNKADILFVIDNSPTMGKAAESMAVNFTGFIGALDSFEQQLNYEGLPDAVTNYVDYVQNRSSFVDYQFGITSPDVDLAAGELAGPLVRRGQEDVPASFVETLVCESMCFDDIALATDPAYQCGDPLGDFLSEQFMSCTCTNNYNNCAGATEEGLEAVFLAMCRAVENPPAACFEDVVEGDNTYPALLRESDKLSNQNLLRPDANLIVVIVGDEGDHSRRLSTEIVPDLYEELFAQFRRRMTWVYIGDALDETGTDPSRCGIGTEWGLTRYHYLTYVTNGRFIDMFDASCDLRSFEEPLTELGELLTNLLTEFPLQSVPVPGTLIVLVDGDTVDESDITGQDQFGLDQYSDGWSYRASDNAVVFHGAAVPTYDARVEVYYKPIDGMPRDLPF